jgi:hypothetical protein
MRKKLLVIFAGLLLTTSSAYADAVLHIWHCHINDGYTGDDVMTATEEWFAAARAVDGGADLIVYLDVPIAAKAGDGDFNFVLEAADERVWGNWFAAEDEGLSAANEAWSEVARCSSSSMWYSNKVE